METAVMCFGGLVVIGFGYLIGEAAGAAAMFFGGLLTIFAFNTNSDTR